TRLFPVRSRPSRILRPDVPGRPRVTAPPRGAAARDVDPLHPARRGGGRDEAPRAALGPRSDRRDQCAVGRDPWRYGPDDRRPAGRALRGPCRRRARGRAGRRAHLARAAARPAALSDTMANRHPPTASDWPFPFPAPGRPRAAGPDTVPPATAY